MTNIDFRFSKSFFWVFSLLAIPIILEKSSVSFSFILINKYVIDYGESVLAGYGIANRFNSIAFSTITGIATGLSPIISQNLGANNEKRAKEVVGKTFVLALGIGIVAFMVLFQFKEYFVTAFVGNDKEVIRHTINAMSVYSVSVIPWAVIQVANGVFQGTGHTKYNLIISMIRIYGFRLPLVIILSRYTNLGEYSIWQAMLISNFLTAIVAWGLYLYHKKDFRLAGENEVVVSP